MKLSYLVNPLELIKMTPQSANIRHDSSKAVYNSRSVFFFEQSRVLAEWEDFWIALNFLLFLTLCRLKSKNTERWDMPAAL